MVQSPAVKDLSGPGVEPVTAQDPAQTGAAPPAPPLHPSDSAPPTRTTQRLSALLEVALCSDFPTQLLLTQLLTVAGLSAIGPDGELSLRFVVTLSLVDTAVLVALILYLLKRHGETPSVLFVGQRTIRREAIFGAVLIPVIFLGVQAAFAMIERFGPWLRNVEENPLEALIRTPGDAWLFAIVAIVAGGIREEVQRAFILRRFEQHLGGGLVGLVVFSVAFGAGHLIQGWDAAVITTLLGATWGAIYLRRRSIVGPVVSHAGFNTAEIIRYVTFG